MEQLLQALDRFIERLERTSKRRILSPIIGKLERAMQKAFRTQCRAFLERLATLSDQFPVQEAVKKVDWFPHWDEALQETDPLFTGPIAEAAGTAMQGAARRFILDLGAEIGAGISFDLKNPRAVAYLREHGAELVTKVNQTTKDVIRGIVVQGVDEGWSYDRMAKEISSRFEEFAVGKPQLHIDSRAHLVAITECFPGDVLVAPFALPIPPLGLSAAGPVTLGQGFCTGSKPSILGATRRWHEGNLVEIITATGNKLTGTPNHPVLTDRGWVALSALVEGDNLVCCGRGEGVGDGYPYIDDVPAPFSEIFGALKDSPVATTERVATTHVDFHGDGQDGEVEIVWANSNLPPDNKAALQKQIGQQVFAAADLCSVPFAAGRLGGKGAVGLAVSPAHLGKLGHAPLSGGVGFGKAIPTLFGGSPRPHHQSGFRAVADVDTCHCENCPDVVIRDAIAMRDGLAGFAGQITRDHIVSINKNLWRSGHVYNLLTRFGYYTANGVIVQNCGEAYEEGNWEVAQDLLDAGFEVEKFWSTMGDNRVSAGCTENEAVGWILMNEPFPSGDMHPLRFPGCRCDCLYQRVGTAPQQLEV